MTDIISQDLEHGSEATAIQFSPLRSNSRCFWRLCTLSLCTRAAAAAPSPRSSFSCSVLGQLCVDLHSEGHQLFLHAHPSLLKTSRTDTGSGLAWLSSTRCPSSFPDCLPWDFGVQQQMQNLTSSRSCVMLNVCNDQSHILYLLVVLLL